VNEPEVIGDVKGETLRAWIDRDGSRPAPILADEDVGIEIDTEFGSVALVAANLRKVAMTLSAIADELEGKPTARLVPSLERAAARRTFDTPPANA
jgi:hypothetical protein